MAEGGESALVAQQRFADEIPYKNIDTAQQSIQLGLSAWQTANAIKLKRAEIEGKMFALQQRNMQLEANMELREKMFGLAQQKNDWEKEKAFAMVDFAQQRLGIQQDNQDRLRTMMNIKQEKDQKITDAQSGFFEALHGLQKHPGDPGYDDDVFAAAARFPDLPRSVATSAMRSAVQQHMAQVQRNQAAFDHKEKTFWEDYGRAVYGDKNVQNPAGLRYQGADMTGPGGVTITQDTVNKGTWWTPKLQPTGDVTVTWSDSKGTYHNKVPAQTLTDLNKQYQSLLSEKNALPTQRNYPDLNLYPSSGNKPVVMIGPGGQRGTVPASEVQRLQSTGQYSVAPDQ